MSYNDIEDSVADGAPIELYEFSRGLRSWNFASCANDYFFNNKTFIASAITRDRIKQGTDTFKNDISITLPRDNPFAQQFLGFAPDEVTSITIYRGHAGDGNFISYWKGRVVGAEVTGNTVQITGESVFTSLKRPGLRAVYELTCRHPLYSVACGVSAASFEVTGTVASVSGSVVDITAAASKPDGYFTGGILAFGAIRRFIINHQGIQITLSRPMTELIAGNSISIFPGCDHTRETCHNKFDNIDNYGGFPWIPIRNPFDGGSIV